MARRKRHLVYLSRVPHAHEHTAGIGVVLDEVQHLGDLVYAMSVRCGKAAPLVSVDRAQVSVFVGPFVPDGYSVLLKVVDVSVAAEKPQKFVDNGLKVNLLSGQKGKSFRKVEAHLVSEYAFSSDARAVRLHHAFIHYALQKFQILFHR